MFQNVPIQLPTAERHLIDRRLELNYVEAADDMADRAWEAAASRAWAGIHYVIDDDIGLTMGRQVGRLVSTLAGDILNG